MPVPGCRPGRPGGRPGSPGAEARRNRKEVAKKKSGGWRECFAGRHSISLSFFLILPLLITYEIGISLSGSGYRNTAELILKEINVILGADAARFIHWFLAVLIVVFFLKTWTRDRPFFPILGTVVIEGLVIAFFLGPLLSFCVGNLLMLHPPADAGAAVLKNSVLLSIGAGVYEEIVFRFFILGGTYALCSRVFKVPRWTAFVPALLVSALLFSVYHHIGPFTQPITWPLFLFRFIAGLALGLVFIFRGFAVTVYVHAFYDIFRDIEWALQTGS